MRSIGARMSSRIVRKWGMTGLPPGHLTLRLRGSCGQSLGAFAVHGLKIEVFGDANDYVGKGLSGATDRAAADDVGRLSRRTTTPSSATPFSTARPADDCSPRAQAGERFAVRNSGATAVVEGCGANGCEYMTGGMAVLLGPVGDNFGAGMTGGMAFVYDEDEMFEHHVNADTVIFQRVQTAHWATVLRQLVQEHVRETDSEFGARILAQWETELRRFWQVVPKEMLTRLAEPLVEPAQEARA